MIYFAQQSGDDEARGIPGDKTCKLSRDCKNSYDAVDFLSCMM